MPLEPIHRSRYVPSDRPPRPDRAARAIRAARLGAVLAAGVAILTIYLTSYAGLRLPFDSQLLVIAAFVAPILVALLRPPPES